MNSRGGDSKRLFFLEGKIDWDASTEGGTVRQRQCKQRRVRIGKGFIIETQSVAVPVSSDESLSSESFSTIMFSSRQYWSTHSRNDSREGANNSTSFNFISFNFPQNQLPSSVYFELHACDSNSHSIFWREKKSGKSRQNGPQSGEAVRGVNEIFQAEFCWIGLEVTSMILQFKWIKFKWREIEEDFKAFSRKGSCSWQKVHDKNYTPPLTSSNLHIQAVNCWKLSWGKFTSI